MSYRSPRYCFLHAARDAGAAAISCANTFADNGAAFAIDDRAGSLSTFTAVADDHYYQANRGAAGLEACGRLIIPAGHNLDGLVVRVRSATDAGITGTVTTLVDSITAGAGMIDEDFDVTSTQQYIRLDFPGETGINPALPQLIYTRTRTTTRGPEPGWTDMLRHNTLDFPKESGVVASLSLGADRRLIEYVYRYVSDSDDLAVFSELIETCGTSKPFYLDPCFDTEATIWMKLTEDSRQQLDRASPSSPDSARPEIPLSMLEHLA